MKVFVVFATVLLAVNAEEACYLKTRGQCRPTSSKPGAVITNDMLCNARYGGIGTEQSGLGNYVNTQFMRSFDYLLMSTHFANYETNRAGFVKLYRKMSDAAWENGMNLIKYMSKRGATPTNFKLIGDANKRISFDVSKSGENTYEMYELESLAKALDIQKEIARDAISIHKDAIDESSANHDPELASYIEEEFSHKQAEVIRELSGHANDLRHILHGSDHKLGLYLFDEYLQKLYIKNCEEYIFGILNNHDEIFHIRHIAQLLMLSTVPLLIAVIILTLALASIIAFLRYTYKQLCKRSFAADMRNRCCFYIQAIGTIVLITLLLTGIVAMCKITLLLDNAIRNDIVAARGILTDLHYEKAKFALDLINVNESLANTLLSVENVINTLPALTSDSITNSISEEMDDTIKQYNEIMHKSEYMKHLTGMDGTNTVTIQNLEEQLSISEKLKNIFIDNLKLLEPEINNNAVFDGSYNDKLLEDVAKIRNNITNIQRNYKFPNWILINTYLANVFEIIMPQINESFYFTNAYFKTIQDKTNEEIAYILLPLHHFQNESNNILEQLNNISENIYPEIPKWFVTNLVSTADATLSYINGNDSLLGNYYNSTLLLMMPTLHSTLYTILMAIICVHAVYQMKYVYTRDINGTRYSNCSVISSKLITAFGLSLLWTSLMLAALCYMGALSLSVVCTPIMSDHLYTEYIDNTQVWANNTWLDQIVYPWGHGYRMKEILEKCATNVTVYRAFDVEQYWTIREHFRNIEIPINDETLTRPVENAILTVQVPDGKFISFAKDNFSAIEMEIKQLSPHIMYDVERFQNGRLKKYVEQLIETIQAAGKNVTNIDDTLTECLNIAKFLANQKWQEMLNDFMDFKYMIKTYQNDLNRIQYLQERIKNKIHANLKSIIQINIENVSDHIKHLMNHSERHLANRIENEIGNCYFMPRAIEIAKEKACIRMPFLFNMGWTLLLFNALFMVFCMILSSCMSRHMTAVRYEQQIWHERIERDKQRETTRRIAAGTLLFDRTGKFMGESKKLVKPIEEE
ncbi:Ferritin 2 light chain homologue [Carabus blaptoides fortunei]